MGRAYCIRQGEMGAGSWTGGCQENLFCIPFSFKARLTSFGKPPPQSLLLNYLFHFQIKSVSSAEIEDSSLTKD